MARTTTAPGKNHTGKASLSMKRLTIWRTSQEAAAYTSRTRTSRAARTRDQKPGGGMQTPYDCPIRGARSPAGLWVWRDRDLPLTVGLEVAPLMLFGAERDGVRSCCRSRDGGI